MARVDHRHPDNIAGDWFVDDRCISCGASAAIAPQLIGLATDGRQFVFHVQPSDPEQVRQAQLASEVCPTRSIATTSRMRWPAHHPLEIADGIWRCGSNSPDTVGGNSYLVRHSSGNVLVDTPRYTPRLRHELGRLGGVTLIALTHRDEVGDTERYASEFGSEVLIHEADADAAPFATRILRGADVAHVTSSMVAIPTPGHTEGHLMFLTDDEMLFTGDSLAWDPHTEDLCADRFFCWYSWPEQLSSLARLADHRFVRVIPTHGALSPTLPPDDMRRRLQTLLATHRVTTQPAQPNRNTGRR